MIRIAVAEDDRIAAKRMKEFLAQYGKEHQLQLRVDWFTDGDEILNRYRANYDLIILDIDMPLLDGMSAARCIRKKDAEVIIVFATNLAQYAMEGYKVDAMDYLLKPMTYFSFVNMMDKAVKRLGRRTDSFLTVPIKGGMQTVRTAAIGYIEVMNHDVKIHTTEGAVDANTTLQILENQLADSSFFRCSKSCLVNLQYVEKFQNNDVTVMGQNIQVSRNRKKSLLEALNRYMNEVDV